MRGEVQSKAASQRSYGGLLRDPGPGIHRALVPSAILHLPLALLLVGAWGGDSRRPLIDRDIYMVSAVALPKARDLPDKAAAPKKKQAPAPKPKPKSEPAPQPDELVLKEKRDEEKEPQEEEATEPESSKANDRSTDRASLLASLTEKADELRFATDPDGDPEVEPEAGLKARFGRQLTPYERQVRDAIQYNWFPKFTGQARDGLWAAVGFDIDTNGSILAPEIEESSGDYIYDQSCLRAVIRTRRVPPPPSDAARRISVGFSPQDKQ